MDQLPELRSSLSPWFSPYRDLAPILRRFNPETSASAAIEHRLQSEALDTFVVDGSLLRQQIAQQLTTKLCRRLRHSALFQFHICREFEAYAEATGISFMQALQAWYEVWSVLQGLRPDISRRIGVCPWCGGLFWRYKGDGKSDGLCSMVPRTLNRRQDTLAELLSQGINGIDSYRKAMRQRFGDYDLKARNYYGSVRRLMLMPVLSPIQEPISLPATVADPHAFLTVWAFVFDEVPCVLRRMLQCEICGRIATRDDLRRRTTCSTSCRLKCRGHAHASRIPSQS